MNIVPNKKSEHLVRPVTFSEGEGEVERGEIYL